MAKTETEREREQREEREEREEEQRERKERERDEKDHPERSAAPKPDARADPTTNTIGTSTKDAKVSTEPAPKAVRPRVTASGRQAKVPEAGAAVSAYSIDPAAWDPRLAPQGTPIAFPDPDEPYPQFPVGTSYPPPPDTQAADAAAAYTKGKEEESLLGTREQTDEDVQKYGPPGVRVAKRPAADATDPRDVVTPSGRGQVSAANKPSEVGGRKPTKTYDT